MGAAKRNSMETHNSLFIASTSIGLVSAPRSGTVFDGKQPRLYNLITQAIARGASIQDLAQRLIGLCELAYGQRDIEALSEASQTLCNLPLASAQEAGRYYQAIATHRRGDSSKALAMLAELTESPRVIQTSASIHFELGDLKRAAAMHMRAMRTAPDAFTVAGALMNLSAIASATGDHQQALESLQSAWPMVKAASFTQRYIFFAFANDLAWELLQVGRVEQAAKYSAIAVASPLTNRYAEWRETQAEIVERQSAPATIVVSVFAPISSDEKTEEIQASLNPHLSESIPPVRDFPDVRKVLIFSRLHRCNPSKGPPATTVAK
jgi:tetratricopeptide (TPR) repeat protein